MNLQLLTIEKQEITEETFTSELIEAKKLEQQT